MEVRLVAKNYVNNPYLLPYLAVKISTGKVRERGLQYYLDKSDVDVQEKWFIDAKNFPSVLEHVVFTFFIKDISRICSHQLVRHRLCSFTQESQRYSDNVLGKMVEEISKLNDSEDNVVKLLKWFKGRLERYDYQNIVSIAYIFPKEKLDEDSIYGISKQYIDATQLYFSLLENGVKKEEARYVLPQAIKTSLLMTVNLRELLHIIRLRRDRRAQAEIYELADKLYGILKNEIDVIDKLL